MIRMHRDSVSGINHRNIPSDLFQGAKQCWEEAYELGKQHGYPQRPGDRDRAHRHHRLHDGLRHHRHRARSGAGEVQEAGGRRRDQDRQQHGAAALIKLGYTPEQVEAIVSHIDSTGTIEGAPHLKPEHLAVFDCSFRPQNGTRSIHYMGHLKMMGAVQPFISGAISKTINMPEECTVEDVMDAYIESWRLGLKAVAIYRDNSKKVQPLSSGAGKRREEGGCRGAGEGSRPRRSSEKVVYRPVRRKLPDERHIDHAQVFDRRPRRLHHGRHVRRWHAGRDLHHAWRRKARRFRA